MQSIQWYFRRLLSMGPGEISWRAINKLRDIKDEYAFSSQRDPVAAALKNGTTTLRNAADSWQSEVITPLPKPADQAGLEPEWRVRILAEADAIMKHQVRLMGERSVDLGPTINWNFEYAANRQTPMGCASKIDYRDHAVTGDCKWVWELNRHHHLVVLAKAFRLSGEHKYANEVAAQIKSWLEQCPFGTGMNWRSPLELAIRIINWAWALELIRPTAAINPQLAHVIELSVYQHLWEISRKYSKYSSANNHLIGEAAGVFIASQYFRSVPNNENFLRKSREILLREITAQTYEDGGHRELALGYHHFVLQFFLLAGLAARNAGHDFPEVYWKRLKKMFEFTAAFHEAGPPPVFGDCDDGYVLPLGERNSARGWIAAAGLLFQQADFAVVADKFSEEAYWLIGADAKEQFDVLRKCITRPTELRSKSFSQSGLYLLQDGSGESAISVTFDCAELGFQSIAAHGHADALSFTLRVGGLEFLVDPGTYDYFTHPEWRTYFRKTCAHNTIEIDGQDQSQILGSFLWGLRARCRCTDWAVYNGTVRVTGEHDGYRTLQDPVIHRRSIELKEKKITVTDNIIGRSSHRCRLFLHFASECDIQPLGLNKFSFRRDKHQIELQIDPRLNVILRNGQISPEILGWRSQSYHERSPITTLVGDCESSGEMTLRTIISVGT